MPLVLCEEEVRGEETEPVGRKVSPRVSQLVRLSSGDLRPPLSLNLEGGRFSPSITWVVVITVCQVPWQALLHAKPAILLASCCWILQMDLSGS